MSWDILRLVGALAPGSPLRKPINQAILKKLRSPEWQELLRRNLGDPEM
jgi:ABC-type amino acid transport substrate-binding protein